MKYFFYPVSAKTYQQHPSALGWDDCLKNKSTWVQCDAAADYISVGYVKGGDVFVYEDVLYFIHRVIMDISNNQVIVVGIQSTSGYDVTDVSNYKSDFAPGTSASQIITKIDDSGIARTTEEPVTKEDTNTP